ncbi:hypothetical protein AB6A40_003673 [Gnathostoma spinigerum]|uniref:SUN domain-containing protein n=1 Tax=Gnathostoma spinigerum TaxID=75299 RepID=A0ABD6EA84_9BILA
MNTNSVHASVSRSDNFSKEPNAEPVVLTEAAKRNYASKECGAKVLFSNEEAENKNAPLNEREKDEYMRNPCERAKQKWLIVELCETIQPSVIEMANFELFSSGFKDIRFSSSERYPSNDWTVLGEFTAENNREVQQFEIYSARIYAKFLKIELLSHYGNEHYCTLSLIRVFGMSMVEEYEAEAEGTATPVVTVINSVEKATVEDLSSAKAESATVVLGDHSAASEQSENPIASAIDEVSKTTSEVKDFAKNEVVSGSNDLPLVNAVVNAVGQIGNIRSVIESAFNGWKKSHGKRNSKAGPSIYTACQMCPAGRTKFRLRGFCDAAFPRIFVKATSHNGNDSLKVNAKPEKSTITAGNFKRNSQWKKWGVGNNSCLRELTDARDFIEKISLPNICKSADKGLNSHSDASRLKQNESSATQLAGGMPGRIHQSQQINNRAVDSQKQRHSSYHVLPAGTTTHKESVFLKLSKRISTLELNISLSSEYLSELSRRYVEYMNESRRHTEKTMKRAEEVAYRAADSVQELLRKEMRDLMNRVDELSTIVRTIQTLLPLHRSNNMMMHKTNYGRRKDECKKPSSDGEGTRDKDDIMEYLYIDDDSDESSGEVEKISVNSILYSNDHMWTTEQLVFMVILAQILTVVLMLLAQCCYFKYHGVTRASVESIVNEQIKKVVQPSTDPHDRQWHPETVSAHAVTPSFNELPLNEPKAVKLLELARIDYPTVERTMTKSDGLDINRTFPILGSSASGSAESADDRDMGSPVRFEGNSQDNTIVKNESSKFIMVKSRLLKEANQPETSQPLVISPCQSTGRPSSEMSRHVVKSSRKNNRNRSQRNQIIV